MQNDCHSFRCASVSFHSDAINSGILNITTLVFCHISYMVQFAMREKSSCFFPNSAKNPICNFFHVRMTNKKKRKNSEFFFLYLDMRKKKSSNGQTGFFGVSVFPFQMNAYDRFICREKNSGLIEINSFFLLPHVYG